MKNGSRPVSRDSVFSFTSVPVANIKQNWSGQIKNNKILPKINKSINLAECVIFSVISIFGFMIVKELYYLMVDFFLLICGCNRIYCLFIQLGGKTCFSPSHYQIIYNNFDLHFSVIYYLRQTI